MRGVPEIAILAGTGVLASGKVWKEAKASLVVQPYGSASSPVPVFSLLERSGKKRKRLSWSSPTGRLLRHLWRLPAQSRQYGRARAALASEREGGGLRPLEPASGASRERAGIPRLKNALHFSGAPNRAIAGETLYIYTRSVLIMMIVTPAGGRSAPALDAGARALLGPRVGAPGARAQKR
jgi:hypothetical protein